MEDFLKELMTKQILQMSIPIMFSANELLLWISEKFLELQILEESFLNWYTEIFEFDFGRFGRKTILIVEMLRTLASLSMKFLYLRYFTPVLLIWRESCFQ